MSSGKLEEYTSPTVLVLAGIVLVVAILYFAKAVLLPFALALLLTFLLTPVVMRLERTGLPRIPAVLITAVLAFSLIGGLIWVVASQMVTLVGDLPRYEENLVARIRSARGLVSGGSGKVAETVEDLRRELTDGEEGGPENESQAAPGGEQRVAPGVPNGDEGGEAAGEEPMPVRVVEMNTDPLPMRILRDWLGPLLGPLGTAAIVIVFVLFMLIQREHLRDRIIRLAGTRRVYVTTQAIDEAAGRVSRYLMMQLVINATYGLAVATGLFFIGVPNAILWGLLATVFRFVPYVGPWVAAIMPIALALAVFEGWTRPLLVIGMFVVIELLSNNIMEPWLYGSSAGMSTVGIIVAATFWTWLWGPVGLMLSMPLTVCLVVLGRYVPALSFISVLFSDQPALQYGVRFYQRLLAFDDHEAGDLVATFLKDGSLDELYEKMLLPALSMSERDRNEGHLSGSQERFVYRVMKDVVSNLSEEYALPEGGDEAAAAATGATRSLKIVCLPAEDRADRAAGLMIAQLLTARGHAAEAFMTRAATPEAVETAARHEADCVIISALAPGGQIPTRRAALRLRARLPQVKIIAGLWNAGGELTKTRERMARAGVDLVTTSLSEAVAKVQEFAEEEKGTEDREQGTADRGQGTGDREQGTAESREQIAGSG